ncbi:hypothetical protein A0H81_00574 [Grifola frondosa]|uniref:Uncharacterized protein n=1 Tax=Grifola frondosa TaxID=5627 RepID=A0A1C7MPX6_GRIFR|nr:hypothetical protein A0H81_00574 [Grifola frondosa]
MEAALGELDEMVARGTPLPPLLLRQVQNNLVEMLGARAPRMRLLFAPPHVSKLQSRQRTDDASTVAALRNAEQLIL